MKGAFITGTDTGAGKTLAACALVHALSREGRKPVPMKPIAAGADGDANDDTLALLRAAGWPRERASLVTPVLLREALAPHIAAAHEGREISLDPVIAAWRSLRAQGDFLVVEGVGGWKVPLGRTLTTVDLARVFGMPVVLVVGLRLGCLNHALLTAQAVAHDGFRLAGWIGSCVDPRMAAREENIEALAKRLGAPCIGILPWSDDPDPAALAGELDPSWLLA